MCYANFSCIQEDEYTEKKEQSTLLSPDIYYERLYTAQTQAFESLYEEITIEDTYLSISKKIDKAAKKNSIINGCDMNKACICTFPLLTRAGKDNLSDEYNKLTAEIQKIILESKNYDEAKNMILELYNKTESTKYVYEQNIMQAYLKYNIDLLDYLATNMNRISLIQYLWKYNDPELNQPLTRETKVYKLPGIRDGFYGVGEGDYYVVSGGLGYLLHCPPGLYFFNSCLCCNFPDYKDDTWDYWAKCIAAILSGAILEGLGGAGVGSAVPGIGTTVGGVVGVVGGALGGFIIGC